MPLPFYLKVMMKVDAVISLESINYVVLFKLKAATPDIKVPAPPGHPCLFNYYLIACRWAIMNCIFWCVYISMLIPQKCVNGA